MSDLATVAQRIAARTWGGRWIADETLEEHESEPLDEQEEREAA